MEEHQKDHDILVAVSVKLDRVINDVADLKTNLVSDVESLKLNKSDKTDCEKCRAEMGKCIKDQADGINKLNNWRYYIVGIATVITIIVTFISNLISNYLTKLIK